MDQEGIRLSRRPPSRGPPLLACKDCGTLNPKGETRCANCKSQNLTDDWEGMVIVLKPEQSILASKLGVKKQIMRAIKVGGRTI